MPGAHVGKACCERCADPTRDFDGAAAARRRLLKAAVFRPREDPPPGLQMSPPGSASAAVQGRPAPLPAFDDQTPPGAKPADADPGAGPAGAGRRDTALLPRAVCGTVLDVSPQILTLDDNGVETRLALTADALAWRGAALEPAALRPGDSAVVRLPPGSRNVADRIWANIGRVTGIIAERKGSRLVVDEGTTRDRQVVVIQPRVAGRIQVRFPTLEPGYLIDVIGVRREGELDGIVPATSQPTYPADKPVSASPVSRYSRTVISGSATWHEAHDEPPTLLGVRYPALDPQSRCAEDAASGSRPGYARLPYLAIGSILRVTNECTGRACPLPVTGCGPIARLFNDRCVTCGTSPRGRIADLSMAAFVALGGELERACFNATITVGA
jgi:hypothetical protein